MWIISYPDGTVRRLTNRSQSVSRNRVDAGRTEAHYGPGAWIGESLCGARGKCCEGRETADRRVSIHRPETMLPGHEVDGLCLLPPRAGNADIWSTDIDGNNRKQLTANGAMNFSPVVSADDTYIVFISWRWEEKPWRMNLDGSNPIRIDQWSFRRLSIPLTRWPLGCFYSIYL